MRTPSLPTAPLILLQKCIFSSPVLMFNLKFSSYYNRANHVVVDRVFLLQILNLFWSRLRFFQVQTLESDIVESLTWFPYIFAARRKAAEGRRRVKTEEEELAGNKVFPKCFFTTFKPFFLSLGAKSEWAASLRRARITIRKLCKMQWWFWTVILMVFLNTCTVAVEHYNQPPWLTEFLCKYLVTSSKIQKTFRLACAGRSRNQGVDRYYKVG